MFAKIKRICIFYYMITIYTCICTGQSDQLFEFKWFSKLHWHENGNARFHFTDSSHILTCLSTKICTSGITGLRQEAWVTAATSEETNLNIAIVVECIDKQNVAFAKRILDRMLKPLCLITIILKKQWFEIGMKQKTVHRYLLMIVA